VIPANARATPKDPFMANLHGVGFVHEVWRAPEIEQHYLDAGSSSRPAKGEVWYRVVFYPEYQEDPDEYEVDGRLLSSGGDNAITFTEDELEILI